MRTSRLKYHIHNASLKKKSTQKTISLNGSIHHPSSLIAGLSCLTRTTSLASNPKSSTPHINAYKKKTTGNRFLSFHHKTDSPRVTVSQPSFHQCSHPQKAPFYLKCSSATSIQYFPAKELFKEMSFFTERSEANKFKKGANFIEAKDKFMKNENKFIEEEDEELDEEEDEEFGEGEDEEFGEEDEELNGDVFEQEGEREVHDDDLEEQDLEEAKKQNIGHKLEDLYQRYHITLGKNKKVQVREEDLIQKFVKGNGKGGQKVNKTNNAVFLKHIPSGLWVKDHSTRYGEQNRRGAHKKLLENLDYFLHGSQSKRGKKHQKIKKKKERGLKNAKTAFSLIEEREKRQLEDGAFQQLKRQFEANMIVERAVKLAVEYLQQKITFMEADETEEERLSSIQYDTRLILAHVLEIDEGFLVFEKNRLLKRKECETFLNLVFRRSNYEPVSYLLGYRYFYKSKFKVTPDTLIPRPSTEHLLEHALELLEKKAQLNILELGVGSGCLLLSALQEFPKSTGTGVDLKVPTLKVARENAGQLGLVSRCQLFQSNWLEKIPADTRYDLIFSNPPYIPANQRETMSPTVARYEPETALFADADGLYAYQQIAAQLSQKAYLLKPNGFLIVEVGIHQAPQVKDIFQDAGLSFFSSHFDLQQIERSLAFKKD